MKKYNILILVALLIFSLSLFTFAKPDTLKDGELTKDNQEVAKKEGVEETGDKAQIKSQTNLNKEMDEEKIEEPDDPVPSNLTDSVEKTQASKTITENQRETMDSLPHTASPINSDLRSTFETGNEEEAEIEKGSDKQKNEQNSKNSKVVRENSQWEENITDETQTSPITNIPSPSDEDKNVGNPDSSKVSSNNDTKKSTEQSIKTNTSTATEKKGKSEVFGDNNTVDTNQPTNLETDISSDKRNNTVDQNVEDGDNTKVEDKIKDETNDKFKAESEVSEKPMNDSLPNDPEVSNNSKIQSNSIKSSTDNNAEGKSNSSSKHASEKSSGDITKKSTDIIEDKEENRNTSTKKEPLSKFLYMFKEFKHWLNNLVEEFID